jgi:hypothetical protein
MDVRAVKEAGDRAVEHCRSGEGPYILEMLTYRYRGHSMSDPGKYRTKEEVEDMMKSDPIIQFGRRLMEQERFTQADLDALDKEILAQMDDAVAFVEASPDPSPESLYEDVYVKSPYIHAKSAEKDPAWKAAEREDKVPVVYEPFDYAAWQKAQAESQTPAPETSPAAAPAPDPATAAVEAAAKVGG